MLWLQTQPTKKRKNSLTSSGKKTLKIKKLTKILSLKKPGKSSLKESNPKKQMKLKKRLLPLKLGRLPEKNE